MKLNLDREALKNVGKGVFLYKNMPQTLSIHSHGAKSKAQEEEEDEWKPIQNRSYNDNRFLLTAPNHSALKEAYERQLKEQQEKEQSNSQHMTGKSVQRHARHHREREKKNQKQAPPNHKEMIDFMRDMVTYNNSQNKKQVQHIYPILSKKGAFLKDSQSDNDDSSSEGEDEDKTQPTFQQKQKAGDLLLLNSAKYPHRRHELEVSLKQNKKRKRAFTGLQSSKKKNKR